MSYSPTKHYYSNKSPVSAIYPCPLFNCKIKTVIRL